MVFQMIGFVEKLPTEWESKWKSMQTKSSHDLEVEGKLLDTLWNSLLANYVQIFCYIEA
jgi:hypothetical protein